MDNGFSIKQQATVKQQWTGYTLRTAIEHRAINCWQKMAHTFLFFHHQKMQTSGAKPWFCQDTRNNDTAMVEHILNQVRGLAKIIWSLLRRCIFGFPKQIQAVLYMKRQVTSQQWLLWRGRTTASEVNPLKRHETGDVLLHQISNPKFSRLDCARIADSLTRKRSIVVCVWLAKRTMDREIRFQKIRKMHGRYTVIEAVSQV